MMTTLIKILIAIVGCCYAWLLLTAHHPVLNPINPPFKSQPDLFFKAQTRQSFRHVSHHHLGAARHDTD